MENKKIIRIITIPIIVFVILYLIAYIFAPGINVNGQDYRIYSISSYQEIKDKIDSLKTKYPQYRAYSIDGKHTKELVWEETEYKYYAVYFYLQEENANVLCCIRKDAEEPLRSIGIKLLRLSNSKSRDSSWKDINSSALSKEENKKIKDLFEKEILNKLGKWTKE